MANIVIMPKQGLQMTSGTITKWLISEGEDVKEGDALFEMETDKLSITIDSSFTGTLLKIIRHEGEEVPITEPIAVIGEKGEDISSLSLVKEETVEEKEDIVKQETNVIDEPKEQVSELVQTEQKEANVSDGRIFITPRAKMRCAERGITDYSMINGTGDNGLIVERDVLSYNVHQQSSMKAFSFISVIVDIESASRFVENMKIEESEFDLNKLLERAVKASQKKTGSFEDIQIKSLLDTAVCEFVPAMDDHSLLAASGTFKKEGRSTSKLTIVYDPKQVDDHLAADFISCVAKMLENPLLMLAF